MLDNRSKDDSDGNGDSATADSGRISEVEGLVICDCGECTPCLIQGELIRQEKAAKSAQVEAARTERIALRLKDEWNTATTTQKIPKLNVNTGVHIIPPGLYDEE